MCFSRRFTRSLRDENPIRKTPKITFGGIEDIQGFRVGRSLLNLDAFKAAGRATDPFMHVILPDFVPADARALIDRDYPKIADPGSFPLEKLVYGPAFKDLIEELNSDEVRTAVAEKFDLDLSGLRPAITVRGQCSPSEGKVHTDSKSKLVTAQIYLTPNWQAPHGGCLRILRSSDLQDAIAEVPPTGGTLVAFRRADNSWHGFEQYVGERRAVQVNWCKSNVTRFYMIARHYVSATVKNLARSSRSAIGR